MACATTNRALIEAVAEEMTAGIHGAVDYWLGQIESVFDDAHMTTLGRLLAIKDILRTYRSEQTGEPVEERGHAA